MKHLEGALAPFSLFSLCLPSHRGEAQLARAMAALEAGRLDEALLAVEYVCRSQPDQVLAAMLRAHIVERCRPEAAARAWYLAWLCDPGYAAVQDGLLNCWLGMNAKQRVRELGAVFLPGRCQAGTEAPLLALLRRAEAVRLGVCWRTGHGLAGRVFHLDGRVLPESISISDQLAHFSQQIVVTGQAFSLPRPVSGRVCSLAFADGELLQGSPLVWPDPAILAGSAGSAKTALHAAKLPASGVRPTATIIDIVIPVYRGLPQVQSCLASVVNSLPHNQSKVRLVVIDDASPERELRDWLQQWAQQHHAILLHNRHNLGFVESVNRGMSQHAGHDVLLLNADTLVHGDWIDRLRTSLYQSERIAAVTAWSNNGEITSFPKMVNQASSPNAAQLAQLDLAAASLRAEFADPVLPVCCGFAMLLRRAALQQVGLLDGAAFHRGYGEEVDWCLRARAAGWTLRLAVGVFVAHVGGVSFGMEKILRVRQNRAVLAARYPDYYPEYNRFVSKDGLATERDALMARLQEGENSQLVATAPIAKAPVHIPAHAPDEVRLDQCNTPVQEWLARVTRSTAPFWQPSLEGCVRRIAVWQHQINSPCAPNVLALARLLSGRPDLGLRLLLTGDISEALWHTGVVDSLPRQSEQKTLFSDHSLLGMLGCVALLSDQSAWQGCELPYYHLDQTFDPVTWLAEFDLTQQPMPPAAWQHTPESTIPQLQRQQASSPVGSVAVMHGELV